jgi:VanZ family protein
MFEKPEPNLKLRFLWLAIGYAMVVLVFFLSLTSDPVKIDVDLPFADKISHALAYFVLMLWFSQIYHDKFQRNMIAFVFVLMGISIEYFQSFDPNRTAEFFDIVANVTGLSLGFILALGPSKNLLMRFEGLVIKG